MSIEKVREHFKKWNLEKQIRELPQSSATVELAAKALSVEPARIAKTLSFKDGDNACILIVCAGDSKIDNARFKAQFGFKARMLSPDEVLFFTGHAIGGVCPFGINSQNTKVYLDISLQRFQTVFPACGSSNSAIELTTADLPKYTGATAWIKVTKD